VLVLGSGYVSGPCVRYLCRDPRNEVIVLSADGPQAAALVKGIPNATATTFDASDTDKLSQHIRGSDVVVSLLPATMHGPVAAACVREKRHMVMQAASKQRRSMHLTHRAQVTASYVSPAIQELHASAAAAGICIMNEVGVDPGTCCTNRPLCFDPILRFKSSHMLSQALTT
jgi:saccharopine dehydrogenase-like NADP-dependent oxidoreductase